ncbi:DUF808 domain-containing protein [Trueperella pecoris]|uniref:DUF808 domain-containing protein n=1 Tax=Trueperella pecoris TaxID=2733571 RepID=A0A7M1R4B4_9ACTO|nr:DUF808 domain-containing protein [Trueperella pecoris]QOR48315.1 DUF808 domain-containing protein [Trueperella pecoris]
MATGFLALLDDIAALARIAAASIDDIAAGTAKASTKAVGVVIDDTAVTPQYVDGLNPARELPIIRRIFWGSLRNKLFFIVPIALLLSQFAPWALTPLLMLGGTYLCYEGAHKIVDKLKRGKKTKKDAPAAARGPQAEDQIVAQATRTDFILSAEIMVIALGEVTDRQLWMRAVILVFVAFLITALVYGIVAILVKMDDAGVALARKKSPVVQKIGRGLFAAMPKIMSVITVVGTLAMLWVGGHIVLAGLADTLWAAPYELGHHLSAFAGTGGFLPWLVDTIYSMLVGMVWGAIVVGIMAPFGHGHDEVEVVPGEDGHLHLRESRKESK